MSKANSVCRECGAKLDSKNWNPSSIKKNTPICKQCNQDRSTKWNRKHGTKSASENKECSAYLGVHIAETMLSTVFKNVERMPNGNPGYDFVCNRGYWVDVKSSATWDKDNRWSFHINKNIITDYFMCIAFDNRDDLTPMYLWLIPGDVINHFVTLVIRKSDISKWKPYELPINNIMVQCDQMR